jgi:hypothetical protein
MVVTAVGRCKLFCGLQPHANSRPHTSRDVLDQLDASQGAHRRQDSNYQPMQLQGSPSPHLLSAHPLLLPAAPGAPSPAAV